MASIKFLSFFRIRFGLGWIAALLALAGTAPLAHADSAMLNAFGSVNYKISSEVTGEEVWRQRVNWSASGQADLSFDRLDNRGNLSLFADPQPTLTGDVHAYGPDYRADLNSNFTYFLRVNGGSSATVPVHMQGAMRLQHSVYGSSMARLSVRRELTGENIYLFSHDFCCEGMFPGQVNTFDATLTAALSLNTGELYRVYLGLNLGATQAQNSSGPVDGWANGYVDPAFMIDPGFAMANPGFSLALSPDVGNPPFVIPEVPEPGTAAMLALGLGVVMGARRLRRRTLVASAPSVRCC